VIDTLCDKNTEGNVAVVCLYCDFLSQNEQSITNMIGAILKQLVNGLDGVPEELKGAFRKGKGNIGGRSLGLPDLLRILKPVLGLFERVFICIDALDELLAENRLGLIEELHWILQESPDVRLFLTGRPHVRAEVEKHLAEFSRSVIIRPTREDIIIYLKAMLEKDAEPDAMDKSLKEDIMRGLSGAVAEMYVGLATYMFRLLADSGIKISVSLIKYRGNFGGDNYLSAEGKAPEDDKWSGSWGCVRCNARAHKGPEGKQIETWNGNPHVDLACGAAFAGRRAPPRPGCRDRI